MEHVIKFTHFLKKSCNQTVVDVYVGVHVADPDNLIHVHIVVMEVSPESGLSNVELRNCPLTRRLGRGRCESRLYRRHRG